MQSLRILSAFKKVALVFKCFSQFQAAARPKMFWGKLRFIARRAMFLRIPTNILDSPQTKFLGGLMVTGPLGVCWPGQDLSCFWESRGRPGVLLISSFPDR